MKRILLAAAIAALLAIPAAAEPYRDFTDLKIRTTVGTTVIRAFPNARRPTFRLLLERTSSDWCVVWLEFARRGLPIDHFGSYGPINHFGLRNGRRALVEGPLDNDGSLSIDGGNDHFSQSFLADQHWVARGTNDALSLLSADVDYDVNGACVAATRTQFTPNLAYRDVVDGGRLTEYGKVRVRGFPGADPTFTLFLEFVQAGTEIEDFTGYHVVLPADACILWLEFADVAFPFYTPSALYPTNTEKRVDVLASGGLDRGIYGRLENVLPWISRETGESFRLVEAYVSLYGSPGAYQCETRTRVQFATEIAQFYR